MNSVGIRDRNDPEMKTQLRTRGEEADLCREVEISLVHEEQQHCLWLPITWVYRDHSVYTPTFLGIEGEICVQER